MKKPYKSKDDADIIKSIGTITDKSWDLSKVADIKDRVRTYLLDEFDEKCCYCQEDLNMNNFGIAIEHILPKSKFFDYTLDFNNLAIVCNRCNGYKLNKNPLHNQNLKVNKIPKSTDFKIVHPFLDEYADHIDYKNFFYRAINEKGRETVYMMKLYQSSFAENKIRRKRLSNTSLEETLLKKHCDDMTKNFELDMKSELKDKGFNQLEALIATKSAIKVFERYKVDRVFELESERLDKKLKEFKDYTKDLDFDKMFETLYKIPEYELIYELESNIAQLILKYVKAYKEDGDLMKLTMYYANELDEIKKFLELIIKVDRKPNIYSCVMGLEKSTKMRTNDFYKGYRIEYFERLQDILIKYRECDKKTKIVDHI